MEHNTSKGLPNPCFYLVLGVTVQPLAFHSGGENMTCPRISLGLEIGEFQGLLPQKHP